MSDKRPDKSVILARYLNRTIRPFLEQYGCEFEPQSLPKKYGAGRFKGCFENSYRMAIRHSVIYVEGLAISHSDRDAVAHAWCVDDNGKVLDRTWTSGVAYLGVPIKTEFLNRLMAERKKRLEQAGKEMYYGLLDDWEANYPLINEFGGKPELWLATLRRK